MNGRKPGEAAGGVLSFTYLDVLVCTMGSLLLMLAMFSERAKQAAIAEAIKEQAKAAAATPPDAATPTPPTDDPRELTKSLAEVRAHQAELERMRSEARQRLRDEQQRASHAEEQQRRIEHDLAKLNLTLRDLKATEEKQSVDQDQAEKDLARLADLLADTEKRVAAMRTEGGGRRSYAIVPYKGPNGTSRRPIYIECTKDAITIQPEGVKLTEDDFTLPITAGNPLAAAVRAAQEEINARAAAAGQTESPDPYPLFIVRPDGVNAYEVALAATKTWDSDFGYEFVDADWKLEYPQPDARLAQITEHAIEQARERQKLLAMAAPRRYSGTLASGGGGGRGRGAGGKRSAGDGGGGDGSSSVRLAGGTGGYDGSAGDEQATGATGGSVTPASPTKNRYGELGGGDSAGGAGNFSDQFSPTPSPDGGDGRYAGASPTPNDATASTAAANGAGSAAPGQAGVRGGQPAGSASAGNNGLATSGSSYAASGGTGPQAPTPFDPHAAPGAERQANSANSASGGAQADGPSGVGLSTNLTKDKNVESAAKTRGENWANAAASQRTSAITRPIQVVVRPDQLAVLDPNDPSALAAGNGSVVTFQQPSERVLDQLAQAIQRQIADWGIAGRGMYWRPELVFVVAPGAERHAARIAALMENSGVDVRLPQLASRPQESSSATR